jgi:UDP-N-acetylglucosamine 4-epimerase
MRILITGGAGFIGSNLVGELLKRPNIAFVRVLDNFATGKFSNLEEFKDNPQFELIEGDIRNIDDCVKACQSVDVVSHQAALGSVPRSINDPVTTHNVNVNGFINMLEAARGAGVKRMVYASSSSVYGTSIESPKVENRIGKVLSPYAASKMTNELYAEAYSRNYGMQLFGFRYFNVFGPKQDANGSYAAVMPRFITAALENQPPTINGDGSITRDFTPIKNVIEININGLLFPFQEDQFHHVLNVACGQTATLKSIWNIIRDISGCSVDAVYGTERKGDILHSLADISLACKLLNYQPNTDIRASLTDAIKWYRNNKA